MRVDAATKARGRARYTADALPRPYLVAAPLTTTLHHARVEVDTERLAAVPGVVAALGPQDDPGWTYSTNPHGGVADTRVFAQCGRFSGDIVGAVAATSRAALDHALSLGAVAERPLPTVPDLAAARDGTTTANPDYPGNLIAEVIVGDAVEVVDAALRGSPLRHGSTLTLAPAAHGFLERVAGGAQWHGDACRVWSTTQCPQLVQGILAELLQTDVRLESVFVGGGFGGKEELALEPAAAVLSRACDGAPVLIELTRAQCTTAYRCRHGGTISVTSGFDPDGRLHARLLSFEFVAGPYDGHSTGVLTNAMNAAARLYPRAALAAHGRAWATNTTPAGAYRGYGVTQAVFAVETHMDEIARLLGVDSIEIRRRNVGRTGDRDPVNGEPMQELRGVECLDALAAQVGAIAAPQPLTGSRYVSGSGLALLVSTSAASGPGAPDVAEVAVQLLPNEHRVNIETAVAEAGQGIYTALVATVARVLGAPEELVLIEWQVDAVAVNDDGMFGSRGAHVTCSAAAQAARALAKRLSQHATEVLGAPASIDWARWRATAGEAGISLSQLPSERCLGSHSTERVALAFGAQAADLVVDRLTGRVEVRRVTSVHDVGVLVSPATATAQIEGGVVQGIGEALHETLTHAEDGTAIEQGLLDHLMPTLAELPQIIPVFVQDEEWRGSGTGAKGIGEATVMAVPAAIANAIGNAVGQTPARFPMTAESLLKSWRRQATKRRAA